LRNRPTAERNFWEGRQACADLERTGYIARVRVEERADPNRAFGAGIDHYIPSHAIPKICSAIKAYRTDMKRVRELIGHQASHADWLEKKAREFQKKSNLVASTDPVLAHDLKGIAKRIEIAKNGTGQRLKRYWKHDFGFILPIKGHEKLRQERELDSQFQVRLGAILSTYLPQLSENGARRPSLRTIARLIVLFLVCADLADENEGQVKLKHNQRRVTVAGVYQQLHAVQHWPTGENALLQQVLLHPRTLGSRWTVDLADAK
jgi:hypothetical protein